MILAQEQWQRLQQEHQARVQPWIEPRLARRRLGQSHPIEDFLFDYYPYSPARLATWHPGHGIVLRGEVSQFRDRGDYLPVATVDDGVAVDTRRLSARSQRLDLVLRLLTATAGRPAMVNCFGLHEWAMVYRLDPHQVRHAGQPLRLSPAAIADAVEEVGLRCTHIDAFRFFTEQAKPRNAHLPTRATQPDLEQPGCLHAGMDLYKYAMWFQPYVGSTLVADCFAAARLARVLDMAASPYDLRAFGLEPIPVETAQGRREYVEQQRKLMQQVEPLRTRLVESLRTLRAGLPTSARSATTSTA